MFIQTNGLTKRYGDLAALDACSLGVVRGEVFGLLGPNGAGKTTLLRLLLGYLKPTSGQAAIDGLDCYRQSVRVRRIVSYLPGEARLFRSMRGRQVLAFFAEIRPGGDLQRSEELAERLELELSRRVAYMSTGMRQKLALAATLAADTPLMILDEPTSNLDPTVRGIVLSLVSEARQRGRTIVFSSHVLSEVEAVCDRVAFLRGAAGAFAGDGRAETPAPDSRAAERPPPPGTSRAGKGLVNPDRWRGRSHDRDAGGTIAAAAVAVQRPVGADDRRTRGFARLVRPAARRGVGALTWHGNRAVQALSSNNNSGEGGF